MRALLLCFVTLCVTTASAQESETTITVLSRAEPYEAMTFHADRLWVGHSRNYPGPSFSVEVYDRGGKLLDTLTLTHSPMFIAPYGTGKVIVNGRNPDEQRTQYTIIDTAGGRISAQTHTIGIDAWGYRWLGTKNGQEYFADFSGNANDTERAGDINLPPQTIFTTKPHSKPRYLPLRFSGPEEGLLIGDELFVIQYIGIGYAETRLVRAGTDDQEAASVFSEYRNMLNRLAFDPKHRLLFASETGANKILAVQLDTGALTAEISVPAQPKSIAVAGSCLFVGSMSEKRVTVLKIIDGGALSEIAGLTVGQNDAPFHSLHNLSVTPEADQIFVRSNNPCNPMSEACDEDYNRVNAIALSEQVQSTCQDAAD